jgi:ABC-type bacteriocin/lantibiotic exporter with double-glycine peptidase domain
VSEIINYSQVDAQRMTNMGVQLTSVLYTPLQILIGVWLMYSYIGFSFLFGMGTMVVMIAATFLLAKKISKVNEQTLQCKDQRMKVTEELLDIIRFIKINAFEKYFYKKLDDKRNQELVSNRKRGVLEVIIVFLYFLSCPLIIFLTFLAYIKLGNEIDPTIAFSTIMIFNILQSPLRQFPSALSAMIQMYTSLTRI